MTVDRARLLELGERFRAALAARDFHRLPLADHLRFTENAQQLPIGEGLWGTASGIEAPQLEIADPATGNAAFLALGSEHGEPVGIGARFRFDGEHIDEIEMLVVRPPTMIFDAEGMEALPPGFGAVEPGERSTRAGLEAAANAYFDGIEQSDGSIIPVRDDCVRIENGVRTVLADSSNFGSSTADQGFNLFAMGVAEQIATGFFDYIPRIRSRRFAVIDEEASTVLAVGIFDQPGTTATVQVKGFGEVTLPPMFRRPTSVFLFEAFQVAGGRIRAINAVLEFMPYGFQTGW